MNFLQGVQEVVRLSGTSSSVLPTTVVSQTGAMLKAVEYFKIANAEIEGKFFDWDFLWSNNTISTIASTAAYAGESDVGIWDKERIFYNNDYLDVYAWHDYTPDTSLAEGSPEFAVIQPDGQLLIVPTPDAVYTISYDYYTTGKTLSADIDEPFIPDQFRYAIVGRALMLFANYEGAEEIKIQGQEMYGEYMRQLENHQLSRRQQTYGRIESGEITVCAE